MSTFIVALDFSVSDDRAIRRAVIQARSADVGLVLIHVETDPQSGQLYAELAAERSTKLEDLAKSISSHDGVDCESVIGTGDVADQVVLLAERRSASLIVVGRHERGLRDLAVSTVSEQIARRTTVPTLIANSLPVAPYAHILLGTRLDEPSAALARWLAGNPFGGSAELSMLFVHEPYTPLPLSGDVDISPEARRADEELRLARQALDEFVARTGLVESVYAQARLQRMPVSLELDDFASELGCDLVAIAGSEKPLVERVVTGSVAKDVVREVEKDILIYPPAIRLQST